ncbi:hypothetical protein EDB81DRAFT_797473, partial [Dactylonectria macrodidyma]
MSAFLLGPILDADLIDLLAVSWIFALVSSVLTCSLTQYGFGRHSWDVPFATFNNNGMKIGAISGTFYGMSIMLTKLSILCFYLTFATASRLRPLLYSIMALVVLYSLTASFEWIYACQPIEKYWDYTITAGHCINWLKVTIFSGIMNAITDFIILLIPIGLLRHLRLPMCQKIGVLLIMATGGFVLVISIVRAKMNIDSLEWKDFTWDSVTIAVLWMVEMDLAIVCACLPAVKPFLQRHGPKLIGSGGGASDRQASC